MTQLTTPVNMNDIARAAGVSQSTVSRVMNNRPGISAQTRDSVITAMRTLGYKADFFRLLQAGEPVRILIAMCPLPEQKEPLVLEYFRQMVEGMREAIAAAHAQCEVRVLPADVTELPDAVNFDGVLLIAYPAVALRAKLRQSGCPYVIVSGDLYSSDEDLVTVNRFESGAECCRYLLASGVKRIGFLLSIYHSTQCDGFVSELRRHGMPLNPEDLQLVPDTELTSFMVAIHHWIARADLPEVLVVSYGIVANMVETMLQLNHIQVPGRVRLVAFDRYPGAKTEQLCITSYPAQMGRRGVQRLLEKLVRPEDEPCQIIVPMRLEATPGNVVVPEIQ